MSIREEIEKCVRSLELEGNSFAVMFQDNMKLGDYSSNIAMLIAKKQNANPLELAENFAKQLAEKYKDMFESVDAASPGFINFHMRASYVYGCLAASGEKQKSLEKIPVISAPNNKLKKVSVEFISANPTGPLHIGNARGGPLGDVIANLYAYFGFQVQREYYHNNAGAQTVKFTDALWHQYHIIAGKSAPEGEIEYRGKYVEDLSREAYSLWGASLLEEKDGKEKLKNFATDTLLQQNFSVINNMGIRFDKVIKESDIQENKTSAVIDELRAKGFIKVNEGATFFHYNIDSEKSGSADFSGAVDAVVKKSDGTPVYFANDISYHKQKFAENDIVIDIFGEGHHGHIPKLQAIAAIYSFPIANFYVVVHGQVTLLKAGHQISMSKRDGNFVTAAEVLQDVGKDAFRYFMLAHAPRTQMKFDQDLARDQSKKNPVYYVQYAHARGCSILKKSGRELRPYSGMIPIDITPQELRLLVKILQREEVLIDTLQDFEVQRLTTYAYNFAKSFTDFYERVHVLGEEAEIEAWRLHLVSISVRNLKQTLDLLGIEAPTEM